MHNVIFGISSNSSERQTKIHEAIEELKALFPELKTSPAYESPCYNGAGPDYLAVVATGNTEIPLDRLDIFVKAMEWNLGRDRNAETDGVVEIDIDIVAFDAQILKPHDYATPAFTTALHTLP